MTDCILDIQNAAYRYAEGADNAVDGVTFSVQRGDFIAVLGANGSGKSTLAKLMNALYTPAQGDVFVCGMNTRDEKNTWEIRRRAGMVFQNPDNQLVATVVREDVAFGLENIGVPTDDMPRLIDEALRDVGLTKYADRAPHTLSGGQKQRVAIAGVLAMRPELIIFDESTAMLDPQGRAEVFSAVQRLNRDKKITVIWITHFMDEAVRCRDIRVMAHGKIVLSGGPESVFSDVGRLRAYRLDAPPMARVADALRQAGVPVREGVLTVADMAEEVARLCG